MSSGVRVLAARGLFPSPPPRVPVPMAVPAQGGVSQRRRELRKGRAGRRAALFAARSSLAVRSAPALQGHPAPCPSARGARTAARRAGRAEVKSTGTRSSLSPRWRSGGQSWPAHGCPPSLSAPGCPRSSGRG